MDRLVKLIVEIIVYFASFSFLLSKIGIGKFDKWETSRKIKILLVGYNGAKNTGADVRVAAIVKQLHAVLGRENIDISIITQNIEGFDIYFNSDVHFIKINPVYFFDLYKSCSNNHLAVLCEGSTLKSKFSNALTLYFCEAAGIMKNQGKPCIAYGSEAGYMQNFLQRCVLKTCRHTYFIARNKQSCEIINNLGLKGHVGTDTAWTFPCVPELMANRISKKTGWDGRTPLVGVAVINPFWWPVKPSIIKLFRSIATNRWDYHYKKWYFFSNDSDRERKFKHYISSIAKAVDKFAEANDARVIIIGMEALDYEACLQLKDKLTRPASIFSSVDYDGYQLTSLLGNLSLLITSRYHARVLSMSRYVPAIAVSMDERLENLYVELGQHQDYCLQATSENLESELDRAINKLWKNRDSVSKEIRKKLPYYYRTLGEMGIFMHQFVKKHFKGSELNDCPSSPFDALGGKMPQFHE